MRKRMVPDDMSLFGDLTHDIRPLAHVTADQKKRCANIVLRQNLKQV